MSRERRTSADLAALASVYFSRPPRSRPGAAEAPDGATAPGDGVPVEPSRDPAEVPVGSADPGGARDGLPVRPHRILVLGCPPGDASTRLAAILTVHLVREGRRAGLVELGRAWSGDLPVPRLRLPAAPHPGAPPRVGPDGVRLLARGLSLMDDVVVHAPGTDGPLQRVLALAASRAVVVPPSPGPNGAASLNPCLRACLEGSHRVRVGVLGTVPANFEGHSRVRSLGPWNGEGSTGLPDSWRRWLRQVTEEPGPILNRPWSAVRLLS